METDYTQILQNILSLPPKERAIIVDQIIISLNLPDESIDELWKNEVESRIEAYNSGKIKKVSLQDVVMKYQKQ
jgi:putative addiction module component (TIGR02574 family)